MRLRRVSHLVVSSVLASCGGGDAQRVTIPPSVSTAPSATASAQPEVVPPFVMDVVPTDPNAKMRFVSLAEVALALAPPDPNRRALYVVRANSVALDRAYGPPALEVCVGALRDKCSASSGATRWIAIAKDGAITEGTLADLDPSRTRDPIIRQAFAELQKTTKRGVWFIDGVLAEFPPARVLTEQTKIAPEDDPGTSLSRAMDRITRIAVLQGAAREQAILALGISAKDRAAVRATLGEDVVVARMTSLARGWLVEIVTLFRGSCGGNGYKRLVVLGSNVVVDADEQRQLPCKGRRPPGWDLAESRAPSSSARFFEDAAALEAASVGAFALVARELESFGAPRDLAQRARSAARDEIRHAALMSRHAGIEPAHVTSTAPARTPFEVALDNAVEGCVNESFAAIVARFQSRSARDEDLRTEFASIADDECMHGDLAWDIAAWLEPRLGPSERSRVVLAREEAKRALVERAFEAAGSMDDEGTRVMLGLPTRAQATSLATAFVASI
jgi:hypothetical protein